jgi:hypothetical protein
MQWRYVRLVVALLVAAALSFVSGFIVAELVGNIPCQGEGLTCNIDAAVGGYGVIIAAIAGPIIFGAALLIAWSRVALGWTLAVLLGLLIGFYLLAKSDYWYYVGFEAYRSFRTFLVMIVPPALTVIVQWLILRIAVRPEEKVPPPVRPQEKSGNEPIPFPNK